MTSLLNHIRLAAILLTAVLAGACSGSDEDTGDPDGSLRITSSASTVKADGAEAVTFRVTYGSTDVSASASMHLVRTLDGTETELPAGVHRFTTTVPGSYSFRAVYRDGDRTIESENSALVTATPVGGPIGEYLRRPFFMQFTSVGCPNCPMLGTVLKLVQEERSGLLTVASFHLQYDANYPDPMWSQSNNMYQQKFGISLLPTGIVDMRTDYRCFSDKQTIDQTIDKVVAVAAPCGVAIDSSFDPSSREVKIEAKVTANTAGVYRYLILLVEDDIDYYQLGAEISGYRHNNVVRNVLSMNVFGERLNQGNPLQPGVEYTTSRGVTLSEDWNPDNMRIIVTALISEDDGVSYYCVNSNECALGGNADYQLNQ